MNGSAELMEQAQEIRKLRDAIKISEPLTDKQFQCVVLGTLSTILAAMALQEARQR